MPVDTRRMPPFVPGGTIGNTAAWYLRPIELLDWGARRYGDAFSIRLAGYGPFVLVSRPEHVREVFSATGRGAASAGEVNSLLAPLVGAASVLTSDGPRHMRQRKLLLPPFHGERLAVYRERMTARAEAMVDSWPVGVPFAVAPGLQELTLDLIIDLVFGVRDETRRRRLQEVLPALARASTPVLFFPWLGRDLGPRSIGGRFARLRAQARVLVQEQIDEHRRGADGDEEDILTLLMAARDEAGRPLTDAELRDELFTLLFAGHETTATALSWAVDLVSHGNGAIRERLAAAAREDDGAYLDAFITEVHRVRPTVPNVVRRLHEPLELDSWQLPAGVIVAPAIWLTHRRPELYPEPEAFRPDRWLGKRPGTTTWLPFGGGIRRCIGASFAQLEMREVLRVVFGRCALLPASTRPEDHKRRTVTNVPRRGARVVLTRREPARRAVAA